ncbi:MAG: chalcone isomerase family protein [Gammaproteobacteria bacterium]|nr:chalcone isomerase family protein [Gammaproteobacteria bacterium]NNC97184.1 chalcone isomerase family protein [Gammaproteobacteria bacterium]NNM13954.1 chalcone isomerase family protein [Gammaproteobacteria bacterium]
MKKLILTLIASIAMMTSVQAAKMYGVEVAEFASVGDQELLLNGVGIRKKGPFKVYLGALYISAKATNANSIIADSGCKRVQLHMLRNLPKNKMVGAIVEGFKANTADMASIQIRVDEFISYMEKVKKGDSIQFDFVPESGTSIVINGNNKGTIVGKDFFDALMRVWIGETPADKKLKAAMLGR